MSLNITYRGDGSAVYRTSDGDEVDQIARSFYGTHLGTTELLYKANRHVTNMPIALAAGIEIVLPVYVRPEEAKQIQLWD